MTTIKDAPVVELLVGTEKFPISDGSGKPVTATIQLIIDKCGIPLVEELDSDASLGTLVRYKQNINIDKIETVTKETSIRELNLFPDMSSPLKLIGSADVIRDLNFKIPSEFPSFNEPYGCSFILLNISKLVTIYLGASYDGESYSSGFDIYSTNAEPIHGTFVDNNTIDNDLINDFKNLYLNTESYYVGNPESPITEEGFDFIDCFITVNNTETIKTTEEITKVVPYIKQQHGWESLITENSDFNNDFNLDFN